MRETDTKPLDPPSRRERRAALRIAFTGSRPLVPPLLVEVSGAKCPIGRDGAGARLDDARASRHHATVLKDPLGHLAIVDEKSKNGTFVNGARVERQRLAVGDVISIGDSCLVVSEHPEGTSDDAVPELLGDSSAMRRARSSVHVLAPKPLTVLITAETGCGKEIFARALHAASGRAGELVAVNCAAIPENLFESLLFGHVAAAFTGATAQPGFFRAATGGTLFLDEIGELPLALQPKLLRAIQERAVTPLGATRPVKCDVRIVAATNRDLQFEVERGHFRGDLLARLFEAHVVLPPLRDRREDILPLFVSGCGSEVPPMTHALAHALLLHAWPFNVREVLATARALCAESPSKLDVGPFRRRMEAQGGERRSKQSSAPPAPLRQDPPIDAERLRQLLEEHDGTVADVARAVGRSRRQVYRWIADYGLRVETFRR